MNAWLRKPGWTFSGRPVGPSARRLFAERGYAATSINDIADAAGVAVQTIYARTGSKAGIVTALLDLIDQEATPASVPAPASEEEAIRALVRTVRGFAERLRRRARRP